MTFRRTLAAAVAAIARKPVAAVSIGFSAAVVGLIVLTYQSVRSERTNAQRLAERRVEVIMALTTSAIERDMKAAHVSVVQFFSSAEPALSPDDLRDRFATAFTRLPYPESFFVWAPDHDAKETLLLFNRAERPPQWMVDPQPTTPYPAVLVTLSPNASPLRAALRTALDRSKGHLIADADLAGYPYAVVGRLLQTSPAKIVGFTVNLQWARQQYFGEIATAVLRMRGETEQASILIEDELGAEVTRAGRPGTRGVLMQRHFVPQYFDPALVEHSLPAPPPPWRISVVAADGGTVMVQPLGVSFTYLALATTTLACLVGMLAMARLVRARSEIAEMHAEFVSTVTHELKTPLASIRLMGETLRHNSAEPPETIQSYAQLLSQEAWRLTRLIDNLLAYGSVLRPRDLNSEAHELTELLDEVLGHFHQHVRTLTFEVRIDVPSDLPKIRGNRTMLVQAIENVIDNAIKYSGECGVISIKAASNRATVTLEIADDGPGISPVDLPRVFDKFFRGRSTAAGGSGLGLAIAKRVVTEHKGSIDVYSRIGVGTRVVFMFPAHDNDV